MLQRKKSQRSNSRGNWQTIVIAGALTLPTNFKVNMEKVKLEGMPRNTEPVVQHAVHDATVMQL